MSACYNIFARLLKFMNRLSFLKDSLHIMKQRLRSTATSIATVIVTTAAYASHLILTASF